MPKGKILMGKKTPAKPKPKDKPNGKKRPLPMPKPMPKPKDKPEGKVFERNFIYDQMRKSPSRGSNPRNNGGIVDPKRKLENNEQKKSIMDDLRRSPSRGSNPKFPRTPIKGKPVMPRRGGR